MPSFKLDGKTIPFEQGESIIKAAYRQGIEIPHYCWHPGLSAPANCRMCLVEILPAANQRPIMLDILALDPVTGEYKAARKPKLQPACQMQATDGLEVKAETSPHVKEARHGVQEFLLLNHPVDCPICDQSGECKLQDYWLAYQKTQKRMRDEPVHKPKAVVFGDTIVYDAERCVMCTRCIRFMEEVAEDPVLEMRERGNLNEITVAPGRKLDGHYTFMTEHVCPVGALTTADFRFKARVWFLRSAKSVCQGCATGCNAWLDYDPRYGNVYRYRPRDNEAVNKYWMCDEGMLTYKRAFEGRIVEALVSGRTASATSAFATVKKLFEGVPRESVGVVFSAQHSLEDNWALRELANTLLGTKNVYVSGRPPGYEDKILIHRDKNPNALGVQELVPTARSYEDFLGDIRAHRITHAIALGAEVPRDSQASSDADVAQLKSLAALVTIASHDGALAQAAHVVLPACTWAEASGTYVNAKSMHQVSDPAIHPVGASRPAWEQIGEVGRAIGLDASWRKLKEIRARLLVSEAPMSTHPLTLGAAGPVAEGLGTTPQTTESV